MVFSVHILRFVYVSSSFNFIKNFDNYISSHYFIKHKILEIFEKSFIQRFDVDLCVTPSSKYSSLKINFPQHEVFRPMYGGKIVPFMLPVVLCSNLFEIIFHRELEKASGHFRDGFSVK